MKYLKIVTMALSLGLFACQGTGDPILLPGTPNEEPQPEPEPEPEPDPDPNPDPQPTSGYTIAVDKTTIDANGEDVVTFSVKDPEGNELTTDQTELGRIYFRNVATGDRLPRLSTTFSSVWNGDYTFVATYKGEETANSVTISVRNRSKYERYKQRVAVYQLTGTWCTYCPYMTAGLNGVSDKHKEHMVVMAAHAASSSFDPYAFNFGSSDLGGYMLGRFGGVGYPSVVYELLSLSDDRASSVIETAIESYIKEYPATCGVKIASTNLAEDGTLTIEAAMTSQTGGTYDLAYCILLDNQLYTGGTETSGIYNDIVCAVSENFLAQSTQSRFEAVADQEITRNFAIGGFPTGYKQEDLRVVVLALGRTSNGSTYVDNLAVCPLGESIDYVLNE